MLDNEEHAAHPVAARSNHSHLPKPSTNVWLNARTPQLRSRSKFALLPPQKAHNRTHTFWSKEPCNDKPTTERALRARRGTLLCGARLSGRGDFHRGDLRSALCLWPAQLLDMSPLFTGTSPNQMPSRGSYAAPHTRDPGKGPGVWSRNWSCRRLARRWYAV